MVKIAYPLLLLALLAPATASAQTPPPDERAAAQAYADAAGRLTDGMKAPTDALIEWFSHLDRPAPGCPRVAKKQRLGAFVITARTRLREYAHGITPPLQAFRSELANVPTADPALISGRAAWRGFGRSFEGIRAPDDLCAELAAWRRAGYPRSTVRKAEREIDAMDEGPASLQRKLEAAVKRMIALGVAPTQAQLFADPYREEEGLDAIWGGT
jgi:hypothetical protein